MDAFDGAMLSGQCLSIINVKDYGAKGNGTTNDSAAIQSAINAAATLGGRVVYFPAGTYKINTGIKMITEANISLVGEAGATTFDATAMTDYYAISIGGQDISDGSNHPKVYKGLGADVKKGMRTITTSEELSVTAGDVILITTYPNNGVAEALWCPTRSYYYKGEMAEVLSRSGTKITLKAPLYDGYSAKYTRVYRNPSPKICLANLEIKRDRDTAGNVAIGSARDIVVENVRTTGARQSSIVVEHVFGGVIRNCRCDDCWYSGTGSSYGIVISSCQNMLAFGNRLYGGRHGITSGGWEPNRHNVFIGNIVDNHHDSSACCFDLHENNEHIIIANNVILNSIIAYCRSVKITDNIIYGNDYPAVAVQSLYSPNEYFLIQNNVIRGLGSNSGINVTFPSAGCTMDYVDISHNDICAVNLGVYININGASITGCTIKKLVMNDNKVVSTGSIPLKCAYVPSSQLSILDAVIQGGSYTASGYAHAIYFDMTYAASAGNLTLREVYASSAAVNGDAVFAKGFANMSLFGCTLESTYPAGGYGNQLGGAGKLTVADCRITRFSHGGFVLTSFAECELGGNVFAACTSAITPAGMYRHNRGLAPAAPTAGSWLAGDFFENSAPVAGGFMGWVCVSAGTPGTWKGYGAIAG